MCGIAGYFASDGKEVSRGSIEPMLASLRHRGPDGFGIMEKKRCILGHARLSIIDLDGGWQPISNEDGRIAVTFNGEIYNFIELRRELESLGHRFRTNSDTEVIVHSYEEWGRECPKRFNGQFAFALYDERKDLLFLCRDRLGVRPLYYAWNGPEFVFASEVKSLLASGKIAAKIDSAGLYQIFSIWTNVFPTTPFSCVFELPPAHTMEICAEETRQDRYWQYPLGTMEEMSLPDALEGTLESLNRSVRLRLRADVPVGAYLSGGLDSSLTTTLVTRWTDTRLKTFSLEFEDPRFDESHYQREMVTFLGTDHCAVRCGTEDISGNFESVLWAVERPILRTAPVPMFLLSRLVRSQGYKVVISGEGADEFFLGYDIFKEAKVREFCSRERDSQCRPHLIRRLYPYLFTDRRYEKLQAGFFLRRHLETEDPFYGHRLRWEQAQKILDFLEPEWVNSAGKEVDHCLLSNLPNQFTRLTPVERTQWTEVETLLSGYLLSSQGDRVCMGNSVEGRYVFLDHEVIEFASRIPMRLRMPGLLEKAILKRIGEEILPRTITRRHKFPYRAPDIEAFLSTERGRDLLSTELRPDRVRATGIFDAGKIQALLEKVFRNTRREVTTSDNLVIMAALSTQIFHRLFFGRTTPCPTFLPSDKVRRVTEEVTQWN